MTGSAMMLPPAKGCCRVCFSKHDPAHAHNAQSLSYAMRFQSDHGRGVTWYDAVAHLDAPAQKMWLESAREAYQAHDMTWPELPAGVTAIAEPYVEQAGQGAVNLPNLKPTTIPMRSEKKKRKPAWVSLFKVNVGRDDDMHELAARIIDRIKKGYSIDRDAPAIAKVLKTALDTYGPGECDVCWWERKKQFSLQVTHYEAARKGATSAKPRRKAKA